MSSAEVGRTFNLFPCSKWLSSVCIGAASGVAVYFILNRRRCECLGINDCNDKTHLVSTVCATQC